MMRIRISEEALRDLNEGVCHSLRIGHAQSGQCLYIYRSTSRAVCES